MDISDPSIVSQVLPFLLLSLSFCHGLYKNTPGPLVTSNLKLTIWFTVCLPKSNIYSLLNIFNVSENCTMEGQQSVMQVQWHLKKAPQKTFT